MKYLIFSDSHGAVGNMVSVIKRCFEDLDGVIFLGDNYADIEACEELFPTLTFHAVAGNCDFGVRFFAAEYKEKLITVDGFRILILHGDRQYVKSTLTHLERYARERKADAVLFGHTHERCERYSDDGGTPLYIFNPGSVSLPREGKPSFGVLTTVRGQIILSHGDVNI